MEQLLRQRAESIWTAAIRSVLPDEAVRRALEHFHPQGRVFLVAAGKAAWQMAHAALAVLGRVDGGIVITKYGHVRGPLPGVTCCEAGHPVPDDNSFAATQQALALVSNLRADDTVLFLLSGGGSALFEKPLLPAEELQAITQALLACGADIVEINTIRKRLSAVKGGRFALACAPAAVYSVVLSDILGDPLDMIASGPACPDSSTCAQAAAIAEKYRLALSPAAAALLRQETPKTLPNVTTKITGSVRELEIDISTAEVVIQPGDAYDLQVSGSPRYESRVSGGVWTIKTTGDWQLRNWENVKFFITVPRDTVFDEVELSIGAGTLKADGLACRTADLEVGAGEMTVKNLTCTQESSLDVGMGKLTIDGGSLDGKNEVSCGMGVAEVAVSRPADYGYALGSGMGSVTIDDYSHSGMGVELEVNRSAATFYDIECGMGEVTITFN